MVMILFVLLFPWKTHKFMCKGRSFN